MQLINETNTVLFDSMADMANFITPAKCYKGDTNLAWYDGATPEQAISMLRTGDSSQVANAQKMLDKFDVRIETHGQAMDLGVAGFIPCVPEYLGGAPESMFSMVEVESAAQPLKILVDTTSSAGVSRETLTKRGTAILAMVMALSALRPIQLETVCVLDCGYGRIFDGKCVSFTRTKINSAPLDLASACFALCHQGFTRRMVYGIAQTLFEAPLHWGSMPDVNMRDPRNQKPSRPSLKRWAKTPNSACSFHALTYTMRLSTIQTNGWRLSWLSTADRVFSELMQPGNRPGFF